MTHTRRIGWYFTLALIFSATCPVFATEENGNEPSVDCPNPYSRETPDGQPRPRVEVCQIDDGREPVPTSESPSVESALGPSRLILSMPTSFWPRGIARLSWKQGPTSSDRPSLLP